MEQKRTLGSWISARRYIRDFAADYAARHGENAAEIEKDILQAKKRNHISLNEYEWVGYHDRTEAQKRTMSTLWTRAEFRKNFTDRRYIAILMNKYIFSKVFSDFYGRRCVQASAVDAALLRTLDALEAEERSTAYGHDLLARAQMLQLLVMLGRGLDDDGVNYAPSEHCNEKTAAILEYLNTHLTEDVSIDALADTFYLSKYYMMRMFREETGFTIHGYLTDKRLRVARDLIAQGMRTTDACFQCGYHDYSAFSRAYKKRFQVSPRADQTKGAQ